MVIGDDVYFNAINYLWGLMGTEQMAGWKWGVYLAKGYFHQFTIYYQIFKVKQMVQTKREGRENLKA